MAAHSRPAANVLPGRGRTARRPSRSRGPRTSGERVSPAEAGASVFAAWPLIRGTPRTSYPDAVVRLGDIDLDHVRRPRDVDRGAGRDHDGGARIDEAAGARGVGCVAPQVFDVLGFRDPPRRDPPLERHLLDRPLVVREPEDRATRA